jgi:hypothetical protein
VSDRLRQAGRAAWRSFRVSYADVVVRASWERSTENVVFEGDFPIQGRYIASTEMGLFRLERNCVRKVSDTNAFGLALTDDAAYVATMASTGHECVILKGDRDALFAGGHDLKWRRLYSIAIRDAGERVHQISACGDTLWLANTANNSLTKIDRHTGEWKAEICPFRCEFGLRIKRDHNHVNSVSAHPSFLMFGAWRINMQGCFGVIGSGRIRYYAYRNAGVHDCHVVGDDFLFSDSFRLDRAEKYGANGCVVRNDRIVDCEYFDANEVGCVRGIAGSGAEMVAGLSFPGSRDARMTGRGGLLLIRDDQVTHRIPMPCAQVYDVVRDDGQSFDRPPAVRTADEMAALLDRALGKPVMEWSLGEALMPRNMNLSLNGAAESRIEEYLS